MRDFAQQASTGLYQRLLGEDFAHLAPVFQRFHTTSPRAFAEGNVCVAAGETALARWIARLAGLPRPEPDVKVRLAVTAEGNGERWERWFGEQKLVSFQRAHQDLLWESFGPMAVAFSLVVEERGLRFVPRRLSLLGVPWPRVLGPRVEALAAPLAEGWSVDVAVSLPLVGQLVRYQGTMKPL